MGRVTGNRSSVGSSTGAAAAALVLAVALAAPAAAQAPYTFRSLVDTTGAYSDFHDQALNDVGGILFMATLDDVTRHGVFTGPDPVANALVIDDNNTTQLIIGNVIVPELNNTGTRLFHARHRFGGGQGIYRGPDRFADAFVNTDGPFAGVGAPALNNAGRVVFTGRLDSGGDGIFTGPNPATDAIVTTAGPYRFFSFNRNAMNQAGALAFRAQLDDGTVGIFTGPDPVAHAVATTANGYTRFFDDAVAIDGTGRVWFIAVNAAGDQGVFTGPNPVTDALVTTAGPFKDFYEDSLLANDAGTVVFLADLDSGQRGIFLGPDPVAHKVIQTGDPLFGKTLTSLTFLGDLNERNELSFRYQLNDLTTGIAVVVVPEPGACVLLAGASLFVLRRRRSSCAGQAG
jgi:hypothetical protein